MATVLQSSSAHVSSQPPNDTVPSSGLRLRSISFTQTFRKQTVDLFAPFTGEQTPLRTRRSSLEARPYNIPRPMSPFPNNQTINTTPSQLTVNDIHNGGASSVDYDSEEEEDVAVSTGGHTCFDCDTSFPVSAASPLHMPLPDTHDKVLPLASVGQKSLSSSLKDRLTLSRPHGPKKRNMFKRFHRQREQQDDLQLYDDGIQTVYPPSKRWPMTTERDNYGFVKASQWLTLEDHVCFEKTYQPIMQRRLLKWRQWLAEHNGEWPANSSKTKRYIRKGIPPELRPQAWMHFSGAKIKMENNPGIYQEYVRRAQAIGAQNEYLDIIERDLHRTFPDNIWFKSSTETNETDEPSNMDVPAIGSLRRILAAFSLYAPNIGYCQSLNYIVGLLLIFMKEEEAFWTFVTIIMDLLPQNIYNVTMEGANIDQAVLMMLLSERLPQIWLKLSEGKSFWECQDADMNGMPAISLVTSHWFLTLFINILPIESVLRVWDCFFYEGQRALFRVALAIFRINEHKILAVDDPAEVFQVVQNMPKRMIDCHQLLDATYNKYASLTRLSKQGLERRRQLFQSRREQRRKVEAEQIAKPNHGTRKT